MYQEEAEQGLLASSGLFRIARMIVTKIQGKTPGWHQTVEGLRSRCEAEFAIYHDRKPRAFSHVPSVALGLQLVQFDGQRLMERYHAGRRKGGR